MENDLYILISPMDYENLPLDPEESFVALEHICQRNMNMVISEDSNGDFGTAIRAEYVATIIGYAKECGLYDVVKAQPERNDYDEFRKFLCAVKTEVARIRFRNRRSLNSDSVLLEQNTKTKIDHYITRLREAIERSDLPQDRQEALLRKIDDLRSELFQPRLNTAKMFTALSLILAGLGAATTISADGPNAVTNIMRLVGKDRETEEAAAKRLAPPPRALPAPEAQHSAPREQKRWVRPQDNDLDDEIPF